MGNDEFDLAGTDGGVRGIFLDRDGVINDVIVRDGMPYPPPSLEALRVLPGVPETLAAFHRAGLRVIVVTNQPDVGSGKQDRQVVDQVHDWLTKQFPIDQILVCFHVDADACSCRKPQPGMLLAAADEWNLDLERCYLVGDRWRDIEAGQAVGCRTFWIDRGYRELAPNDPSHVVSSLAEAGRIILSELVAEEREMRT